MEKLLQKDIPSPSWIVKDNNKNLLSDCANVPVPLTSNDELTMKKMIDWIKISQNQEKCQELGLTEGIGIAAPQIGQNIQMYYIWVPIWNNLLKKYEYLEHALVNPKIIARSEQICALEFGEGCLSVDKKHEGYVPRNYKIQVKGYDYLRNQNVLLTVRGYEAIVFQHEQDHLEKRLYYHHIDKQEPWRKNNNWIFIENANKK